jgi:hypothetical protein
MPTTQTHEICAEGISPHLVGVLANAFGLEKGTVRAWRHPKESEANPTGTGKGNPLDQAARYIRIVHRYNPGNARQAAQYFADLVDELDRAAGLADPQSESGRVLNNLRELMKEESDVAQILVGTKLNEETLKTARREIAQERAALERLDSVIETSLQRNGKLL